MSFKLKLVGYFLLVSVLPLGAAGWGLPSVGKRRGTRRGDGRLQAGLRALVATYKGQLSAADRHARTLATSPDLQHALLRGDRRELRRLVAANHGVRLQTRTLRIGPRMISPGTRVAIVNRSSVVGTLVSGVPLTKAALARLRVHSGLDPRDRLAVIQHGRIAVGPAGLAGAALTAPAHAGTVSVAGQGYRTPPPPPGEPVGKPALALLPPPDENDAQVMRADSRLLNGLPVSPRLIGLAASAVGRPLVAPLDRLGTAANAIARGRLDRRVKVDG